MKELVVISGKGGTGKTSLTAAFAVLADSIVIADCDVDAADLHLVLGPAMLQRHEFRSGHKAMIRQADCTRCGVCMTNCRFDAVIRRGPSACGVEFFVDHQACEGCGVCVRFCPEKAIDFPECVCGEWLISKTRCGPMVHAHLSAASENSGKLVSEVRREAHRIAQSEGRSAIIVDGPPGIGCPVIASVTGATHALVVTEPTVSGEHDLERILALTRHFGIPTAVCVNKWDLNPDLTVKIEGLACRCGACVAGRVRYDPGVTVAQIQELTVVEIETPSAADVRAVWDNLGV